MKKKIINIVNFVREADFRYDPDDLYDTYKRQLELCGRYKMPHTFLLMYDSLINSKYIELLKNNPDSNREVGVWFEMIREQVENCGIEWRGGDKRWDWHVNPCMLMAYTLDERKLLIDELFGKFYEVFGCYPKSVGSWMLDTFSIQYMTEKYGVDAFCICKEQYGTDGFTLWGGYYNQAYYPSKRNLFIPAQTAEMQINAPIFRMLGSDPIYQYSTGLDEHFNPSSAQAVTTLEPVCDTGRDDKWVDWYLRNNFEEECLSWAYTQAGQENSFIWENFGEALDMQMEKIQKGVQDGRWEVMTLGDSGRWFKKTFRTTPATAVTCMDDWKKQNRQSFWYDCKNYRVSFYADGNHVCIRDMFLFDENYAERYWDKVETSNSGIYDALPIIDGYLWSGSDILCSLEFTDLDGKPICGKIEAVKEESNSVLVAELTVGQSKIIARCDEDGITISEIPDELRLSMVYNNTADTKITPSSPDYIEYLHNGYTYGLKLDGGTLTSEANGFSIRANCSKIRIIPCR